MARERGITVNAVQAGGARDTERVWREIAQLGNGRYIPIPQDGGQLVMIETPYDTEIIELQGRINGTVIPYGPRAQRSSVEQKTRQVSRCARAGRLRHGGLPEHAQIADIRHRREAITGRGDLVADVLTGRQKLVSREGRRTAGHAPHDEARAERQDCIDKQMAERKTLNERMAELVKKRDQYVVEQRKKAPTKTADSFDRAVEETLKAQIKR